MDKQAAVNLITQTFAAPFDEGRFSHFVRNLFNRIEKNPIDKRKASANQESCIWDTFRETARQYKCLGTYIDPEGVSVDILIVRLKKEAAPSRARAIQRNFVARHLGERDETAAAVVAYYAVDQPGWRFSLVKMDHQIQPGEETGHLRANEPLIPARRYSFLAGRGEPSYTARQQLVPLLQEKRHNPTLAQLEAAFHIETLSRAFFQQYKELFRGLQEELDHLARTDKVVQAEFKRANLKTAAFAKKLLGQIAFLYFLQKKGRLGVAQGEPWGSGPQDFLRRLFEKTCPEPGRRALNNDTNFFNDVLEPLFYEALAVKRAGNFYPRLNCQIPFLNGGLFQAGGGYNWRGVNIPLTNNRFRHIFDTLDRYNFTLHEDEPLEKEVAVDPQMLGAVFENLLDVSDRKAKGTFYTPGEIVHYMCRESLVNYLNSRLNSPSLSHLAALEVEQHISRQDLNVLMRLGEFSLEHDAPKAAGTRRYDNHLPASIRARAATIDRALAEIKICDPATGSGAFPLGLMQEIVKARSALTPYLKPELQSGRTPYHFKRHAIQESLYGIDIDPGAVDIAKLRLWLSLMVDEEDEHIQPLPNLAYKIVCGNALLDDDYFSRVLQRKGGFDVVIGNPPYGAEIDDLRHIYAKRYPNTTKSHRDSYKVFIEKALSSLVKKGGLLCYIIPNTLLLQPRYRDARRYLLRYNILEIINLGEGVFENVVVPACILFIENSADPANVVRFVDLAKNSRFSGKFRASNYFLIKQQRYHQTENSIFVAEFRELGPDEAYLGDIVDFKDAGINYQRVKVGLAEKGKSDLGQRLLYEGQKESEEDVEFWKGRDMAEYYIAPQTKRYLRLSTTKSLKANERVILNVSYFASVPKLVWRQTAPYPIAALDEKGIWFGRSIQSGRIKPHQDALYTYEYLLALMNASYLRYLYLKDVREAGRVFPQVKLAKLKTLPVKKISPSEQEIFIDLVNKILAITADDNYLASSHGQETVRRYQSEIERLVYQRYGLAGEEIAMVEREIGLTKL